MKLPRILIYMFAVAALCLSSGAAFARAKVALPPDAPGAVPLTVGCIADAAHAAGLPLAALIGILAAENGRTGEALQNDNGTWDLGPFQVNSIHVNELAAMGIAPEAVLQNGCVNAYAAAWVLRREYDRTGDIWRAIGGYHSRTPHRRDAYIARVKAHLTRLGRAGALALQPFVAGESGQ